MSGDFLETEGAVLTSIKGILTVEVDGGNVVKAHLGGKMKKNKINVLPGDLVRIRISPHDLTRGIIIRRLKKA